MNKIAMIIGIIAIVLLVSCGPQQKGATDDSSTDPSPDAGSTETGEDAPGMAEGSGSAEDTMDSEDSIVSGDSDAHVTKEELDQLEKDLNAMEFEDLEGLE